MQNETLIAGFGGQGVLFTGKVMAHAAMEENLHVTWFPSYGPEMRGGTANCTVVISDEEIGSPQVRQLKAVIAMNLPSLDKYENQVAPGGVPGGQHFHGQSQSQTQRHPRIGDSGHGIG